jgi:mannitol-specific phosphotransferase system IIBC component
MEGYVKKIVIAVLASLLLSSAIVPVSALATGKKAVKAASKKSKGKKKLSAQQVAKMKKKAETDGKRREYEGHFREYREMLEAQERGMRQARAAGQPAR